MNYLLWFGSIILGAGFVYFVIGGITAITMTKVGDHPQYDTTPATFGLEFQTIQFLLRTDQRKISAWYLPNAEAERCVLLVHGRNASKQNAISGKLPELASKLHQTGFAVLMIDLRGHGESEGKRYTWGEHERRDVLGGVDFLLDKGFQHGKITVLGISLGGASRIGHAVNIMDDSGLITFMIEKRIGIEANLTSNVHTNTVPSYQAHPLKKQLDLGLLATINTDDPGISPVTLRYEFEVAAAKAGLTAEDTRKAQENALEVALISDFARETLRKKKQVNF